MKSGKLFTLIITVLFASMNTAKAQDMHFSQFYVSNLTLNPATTGVMTCQMRVSAIYRNQWASVAGQNAFNTFGLGVEGKFNVGKKDYVGAGLSVWVDRAGASAMTAIQAVVSASYLKKIGGRRANEHYLVAGAQVGFNQRSARLNQLRWGADWNGSNYGGNTGSENFDDVVQNAANADLSAGLLWFSALDKKNKSNIYAGIGFQHLTKANISFLGTIEPLFTKITIHGGAEARLAKKIGFGT
jgi:type IX secretion system PorP/SprF family membrane protein